MSWKGWKRSTLAVLVASMAAVACSDSPTPVQSFTPDLQARPFFATAPAPGMDILDRTETLEETRSRTKLVENDEGEWLAIDKAGIKVWIPAGALGDDPNVEMEITLTAPAGDRVRWEFAPHGIHFATPILIQVKVDGTELEYLKDQGTPDGYLSDVLGVYFVGDAASGGVTPVETFPIWYDNGWLEFETDHFSGYALAM
jgi:hypothetical protein